jgi:hypothetical protein
VADHTYFEMGTFYYRLSPPAALKRTWRIPQQIDFLWRFGLGAQGA